mmetsp:Transcript_5593/g.13903  ORF Transcript_5593/g.13903 Transcript_5593/m.13903 type:complete len:261 (+) Transcript_5593:1394-2176(+)
MSLHAKHLLLRLVDDGVELIDLRDLLVHHVLLLPELYGTLVDVPAHLIAIHRAHGVLRVRFGQQPVLVDALQPQNVDLVGQDLQLFLHLRDALARRRDKIHKFIPLVLHQVVQLLEVAQAMYSLAALLLQIDDDQLFDLDVLHLLLPLLDLSGSLAAHAFALRRQLRDGALPRVLLLFKCDHLLLELGNLGVRVLEHHALVLPHRLLAQVRVHVNLNLFSQLRHDAVLLLACALHNVLVVNELLLGDVDPGELFLSLFHH